MEGPRVAGTESTGRSRTCGPFYLWGLGKPSLLSEPQFFHLPSGSDGPRRVAGGLSEAMNVRVAHRGSSPLCSRTPEETPLSPQPPSNVTVCLSGSHV